MDFILNLAHYFYPRHSNNHKAKLLHNSSLFVLSFVIILFQVVLNALPVVGLKTLGYAANISADEIIRLTNEKRAQAGVSQLQYNPLLAQAAQAKVAHMFQYDYWAHIAPDGTEPWKFFTDVGYKYRYAGENLARDFTNPQSVVDAWMASQSHRDNLLSSKYTEIGVAVAEGDLGGKEATIVVQLFGNPLSSTSQPQTAQAQVVVTLTPTPKPTIVPSNTPTVSPSPSPTLVPVETFTISPAPNGEGRILETLPPAEKEATGLQLLFSPFETTRGISITITVVLLIILAVDGLVVARKRIPRMGGRTFAHIAFIGMVLAMALIAKAGIIL